MSDSGQSFDEVFRSKLSGYEVSPPDSVWENIDAKRSFGHVVANKISINWRTFGTMLLLLLGGGSSAILFGGEETKEPALDAQFSNSIQDKPKSPNSNQIKIYEIANESVEANLFTSPSYEAMLNRETENNKPETYHIPDAELIASLEQAAFSKPTIYSNPQLNILIAEHDGWESAKPVSFVRFYELEKAPNMGILKRELDAEPRGEKLKYDYVKHEFKKKGFWERSSILLAFTPQTITKTMTADYNLSSSYLEHRLNSEQTRLAYTLEANLHYELDNNRFLETGINFTQIYEEMSFKGEKRFSNQYNFVEIPLLIGFEDRNSKWGYQIKGGLGVQIYNSYKGYIYKRYDSEAEAPDPSNGGQYRMKTGNAVKNIITNSHSLSHAQDPDQVLDLSKKEENPFKSTGVVNLHLAAGITYYHSIKTSFVFAPYYRRSINSITKESALFNERITYMGISLGTRIKF